MKRFLNKIEEIILKETGEAALAALLTRRIEEGIIHGFEVRVKREDKQEVIDTAEKIMVMWKDIVGYPARARKPSDQLIKLVSARSKHFSLDDIFKSVMNRAKYISTSDWHNLPENRHHKLDPTIGIRDDESLEKWLHRNLKGKQNDDSLRKIDVKIDEKLLT